MLNQLLRGTYVQKYDDDNDDDIINYYTKVYFTLTKH